MRTIWKFPIRIADSFTLIMPSHAKLLHVGLDPTGQPSLWAEVDADAPAVERLLAVVGTGNPMTGLAADACHVGSFNDRGFVWHVYDETPEPF